MKRKDFIRYTVPAMGLPFLVKGIPFRAFGHSPMMRAIQASSNCERILVIVQMGGGNDGLNTVLPIDQYSSLTSVRGSLLVPDTAGLKFEIGGVDQYTNTRLHPALSGFKNMFSDQKLAVIQSIGYTNQSYSHFRSTDIWMTASDPDQFDQTGWQGRYADRHDCAIATDHPAAITMGGISPLLFDGAQGDVGIAVRDPNAITYGNQNTGGTLPNNFYGHEVQYIRNVIAQTDQYSSAIQAAYTAGSNAVAYPNTSFASQLKTVAKLIHGGMETKVYLVSIGSFDLHNGEYDPADPTKGGQANLLKILGDGIAAFQNDLSQLSDLNGSLEERVVGMTFSEFGRTVKTNSTNGTDHGTAAPMFLFGKPINATVLGTNPDLYDEVNSAVKSDVELQFDFRSVYATLLTQWFGVPLSDLSTLLFNKTLNASPTTGSYDPTKIYYDLPILDSSYALRSAQPEEAKFDVGEAYPNPAHSISRIPFESEGGRVRVVLMDVAGRELSTVTDQAYPAGAHELQNDVSSLSQGVYFYKISEGKKEKTIRLMVE